MASMNQRLERIALGAKQAHRTVNVVGEDATSAFATIRWTNAAGTILKIRSAWNGGCCSAPEVHDFLFAGDDLIKETFFVAPRDDARLLMRGDEPRSPIMLEERFLRDGRLVFWSENQGQSHVDGTRERERWRAQEAHTLDVLTQLRQGESSP